MVEIPRQSQCIHQLCLDLDTQQLFHYGDVKADDVVTHQGLCLSEQQGHRKRVMRTLDYTILIHPREYMDFGSLFQ
jgi:hypothetical protein